MRPGGLGAGFDRHDVHVTHENDRGKRRFGACPRVEKSVVADDLPRRLGVRAGKRIGEIGVQPRERQPSPDANRRP